MKWYRIYLLKLTILHFVYIHQYRTGVKRQLQSDQLVDNRLWTEAFHDLYLTYMKPL